MGVTSGSGVGFTRNPSNGEDRLYVDFLLNAQGEDVVAGRQLGSDGEAVIASVPGLARELQVIRRRLEALFGDAQDFEFTVEQGKIWLLQTRDAKRTPWAALQIACDMVDEGLIEQSMALSRLRLIDIDGIARAYVDFPDGIEPIGHGIPAGTGVATGRVALSIESAKHLSREGDPVILVREEASTEDIEGFEVCAGLVTARGARTSHAAVVARQLGIACLVSCTELLLDADEKCFHLGARQIDEGDVVTVDCDRGCIYEGELELRLEIPRELIDRVHTWEAALAS
jgi:pyruvate,orthophosphate dikinase